MAAKGKGKGRKSRKGKGRKAAARKHRKGRKAAASRKSPRKTRRSRKGRGKRGARKVKQVCGLTVAASQVKDVHPTGCENVGEAKFVLYPRRVKKAKGKGKSLRLFARRLRRVKAAA